MYSVIVSEIDSTLENWRIEKEQTIGVFSDYQTAVAKQQVMVITKTICGYKSVPVRFRDLEALEGPDGQLVCIRIQH